MRIIYLFIYCCFIIRDSFCLENDSRRVTPVDYCKHPDCAVVNQHTMCVAANRHSPRLFASGMTSWMRYQILLLHNRQRDNIAMGLEPGQPPAANMRKMYWDYELEKMAELWARQCQKRHDECRNTIRFNVLQNMDVRAIVPRVTEAQLLADAVGAWYSGSRMLVPESIWSFSLSNCSSPGGCNTHWYSTAAWASTWRLGCSQALCTAKRPSCVFYRKSAKLEEPDLNMLDNLTKSTKGENILRRVKYMNFTTKASFLDDYATPENLESAAPLYRGILHMEEKRREPKMLAYTFCNYGPAGNIDGFPIYEAGVTCSNCPLGTTCDDRTHRGLCSVIGDPDSRK